VGTPPAKTLTNGELEAQRRERALRAAMAAPIAAVAFEARSGMARGGAERPATATESAQTTAAIVPAAALAAAQAAAAGLPPAPRSAPPDRPEVLPAALRPPASRYEVKAGTIIPAVLVTGVNSDLPGQLIAH